MKSVVLRAGVADVLYPNGCGNYGFVDDVIVSAVRGLLLLRSDTRTGIPT